VLICVTALRTAKRNQDRARSADWPDICLCGERHALVFTTRTGHPVEPRNINRAYPVRSLYGVRITLHDSRRTCGSLLAARLHPRIAMAILRHSRIALTMETYTQVPDKVTRDALRRLSDWLDHDEDQGDEASS
jgi:integrase